MSNIEGILMWSFLIGLYIGFTIFAIWALVVIYNTEP